MNPVVYNSASLANSNLLDLGKDVEELYSAGVRFFHIPRYLTPRRIFVVLFIFALL